MPVQTSYPGVYVEERPSGVRTIVGVSTSVTAFVGAARYGPTTEPVRVTSMADYSRRFGPPVSDAEPMGHMVGQYFVNGGSEAVIVRVVAGDATTATATLQDGTPADTLVLDAASAGAWATSVGALGLSAEVDHTTSNPNDLFNVVLRFRSIDPATGNAVLTAEEAYTNASMSPGHPRSIHLLLADSDLVTVAAASPAPGGVAQGVSNGAALPTPIDIGPANDRLRVSVDFGPPVDLVLAHASHNRGQLRTAIEDAVNAAGLGVAVTLVADAIVLTSATTGPDSSVAVTPAPNDASPACLLGLANGGTEVSGSAGLRPAVGATTFAGGSDGSGVVASDIVPASGPNGIHRLSMRRFPRFNLLVLPGVDSDDQQEVSAALSFCRAERAFLLVDSPPEATPGAWIASGPPSLGSIPALGEHGAIYYPRLQVFETRPGGRRLELDLAPAGAIAGVFARTDNTRGVWKAPAGRSAGIVGISGLTAPTSDDVSGQLNPVGMNVLRSFPGAGTVIWGARTLRGDDTLSSEFKYVPIRRLTDFIASSLYLGTAFAVFEPNDPTLWAQLRLAVTTFMRRLFEQGAFQQSAAGSESDSFFVTCDETVNPQAEIDLGRVNVVVGFAPLKPAEFVIVTITQMSALEE